LTTEVIDYIEQSTVGGDEDLGDFARRCS